jgi:ClpX C4-type zinc finger
MGNSLACSFCGAPKDEGRSLVAGAFAYICNQCVNLYHEMLNEPAAAASDAEPLLCSFCGKSNFDTGPFVARNAANPEASARICRQCLDLCKEIIAVDATVPEQQPRCSFCGKSKVETGPLVEGKSATVCTACLLRPRKVPEEPGIVEPGSESDCSLCGELRRPGEIAIVVDGARVCTACVEACQEALRAEADQENASDEVAQQPRCSFCGKCKAETGPLVEGKSATVCAGCLARPRETPDALGIVEPGSESDCSLCGELRRPAEIAIAVDGARVCAACVDACQEALRAETDEENASDEVARPEESGARAEVSVASKRVTRTITFPRAYRNAGVALLMGLIRVVGDRFAQIDVTLGLRLRDFTVEFSIETDDPEAVETTLGNYARVVEGAMTPEACSADPGAAAELRRHLDLARREVREIEGEAAGADERARRLYLALGWILRGDLEDIEELFA